MSRLPREHGAVVTPVEIGPFSERSVLAIAIENAIEGCVRETYGALVAAYQKHRAR